MKATGVLCGLLLVPGVALAQTASAPVFVGHLAGPGASPAQPGLRLYGTDSGWTFEHRGKLIMLFGDTWPDSNVPCEPPPSNDDAQGVLPLRQRSGVPPLFFETQPDSPQDFARIQLFRGTTSVPMGFGKTPSTGFSDGRRAIAAIGTANYVRCQSDGTCPGQLVCVPQIGDCSPAGLIPLLCDVTSGAGCFEGQTCAAGTGYCIDTTSSEFDGTPASVPFSIAQNIDFAIQRPSSPTVYDSAAMLPTAKFVLPTSRTVKRFTFASHGNDYRQGDDAVLIWGRPWFAGEQGRQAQLYLMALKLPIPTDASGQFKFHPLYFAGTRPNTHEPKWSTVEAEAKPLALDGVVDGSPHENRILVNQMAVSYLPPPIDKWMMLYGGDVPDQLLVDPSHSRNVPFPGSIMIRFADNPWGPWSVEAPYLSPGDPTVAGNPYGPGGFMFHYACVDQPGAACAKGDPHRPLDALNPGCSPPSFPFDIGRLYGVNIIDAYTQRDGHGGFDVFWNLSTWNPYGVVMMKSNVRP